MTELYTGHVLLPADAPTARNARLVVEIRDVSLADAAAPLVATQTLAGIDIQPGAAISFTLKAPPAPAGHSYAYQAYVRIGDATSSALLTVESIRAVPGEVSVPVKLAR